MDMDAIAILNAVSEAYRRLRTLSLTATQIVESGDDNASTTSRSRIRFLYDAPNRMRFEHLGKRGSQRVSDGQHLHTVFGLPAGHGPGYSSTPLSELPFQPHAFRPQYPITSDFTFLFAGINQSVESAEIAGQEDGCVIVSVRHAPPVHQYAALNHQSATSYWVRLEDHLIVRQRWQIGHRWPTQEDLDWSTYTLTVDTIAVNQDLPADAFHFTPPPDAPAQPHGRSGSGGGGGFIQDHGDPARRVEHRSSHSWDGDTLVQSSRWIFRGHLLQFERRLTVSGDGSQVHIGERITAPAGSAEGEFLVPVS